MGAGHGTQAQIHIDTRGGASTGPVADAAAGSRSFDHGGRHGELAHVQPGLKAGIPARKPWAHQRSRLAVGTPDLAEEIFIGGSIQRRTPPSARPDPHPKLACPAAARVFSCTLVTG
jgi:hypothetical protein